jgi:hypothetical protein
MNAPESNYNAWLTKAVPSRYPADLYEPDEKEARQMIEAARRLHKAIVSCLP